MALCAALLTGCGGGAPAAGPSPTLAPTPAPTPTPAASTPSARPFALPAECDDPRLIAAMGPLIKGKKFGERYDDPDKVTCTWGEEIPTAGVTIALPSAPAKYVDFPEVDVPELSALGFTAQSGGTEIAVGDRVLYNQVFVVVAPQFRITVEQASEERRDDALREAAVALTTWLTS